MKAVAAFLPLVAALSAFCRPSDTGTAIVRRDLRSSLLWKTVVSPRSEIMLDWPAGAVRSEVSVDGAVKATVTDTGLASVTLQFDLPDSPADERVAALAAEYFDADGKTLRKDETSLALVCGTGGDSVNLRSRSDASWRRAGAKSAVLPLADGAVALSINGETVSDLPSAPGWYWWKRVPSQPAALVLTLEDGSVLENSVCGLTGLTVILK